MEGIGKKVHGVICHRDTREKRGERPFHPLVGQGLEAPGVLMVDARPTHCFCCTGLYNDTALSLFKAQLKDAPTKGASMSFHSDTIHENENQGIQLFCRYV